ncbi:hypothetical protein LX36DRAFT_357514 [Colletotrichum falcatum]|nr:hypothetical protein LX36DRAFT_357514 [Colletotrichum falcatum]
MIWISISDVFWVLMVPAKGIAAVWATAFCFARLRALTAFSDTAWHGMAFWSRRMDDGLPHRGDTRMRTHTPFFFSWRT